MLFGSNVLAIPMIEIVIGIILIAMAVILTIVVLMQSAKEKSLSSTITGGSDSFGGGKSKAKNSDKFLAKLTVVLTVVFALIVVAMYVFIS